MKVELHTQTEIVGEITVGGDGVCIGSTAAAERTMVDTKILEPGEPPTLVTPEDGERYLRALPFALSGTYFWAELVK